MQRWLAGFAALTLLALVAPIEAQAPDRESWRQRAAAAGFRPLPGAQQGKTPEGVNTIQYDPGAPQGVRSADQGFSFVGNSFDTQNGTPLTSGSLSGIVFYAGRVGAKGPNSVLVRVQGPNSGFSDVPNANSYAFNTLAFSPVNVGAPFIVEFLAPPGQQPPFGPGSGAQFGFHTLSYNGQGFHGVQRNFSATATTAIPNQNLVIRAIGSIAIPVELMEFEVD